MSDIRTSISTKSPYYISKHRYLELKHFCLQYEEWKKELKLVNYYGRYGGEVKSFDISKPVERAAEIRDKYLRQIDMVEQAALEADGDIYEWILKCVTCGVPYGGLRASGIPCSRDYFYERYRKFFWVLDKVR